MAATLSLRSSSCAAWIGSVLVHPLHVGFSSALFENSRIRPFNMGLANCAAAWISHWAYRDHSSPSRMRDAAPKCFSISLHGMTISLMACMMAHPASCRSSVRATAPSLAVLIAAALGLRRRVLALLGEPFAFVVLGDDIAYRGEEDITEARKRSMSAMSHARGWSELKMLLKAETASPGLGRRSGTGAIDSSSACVIAVTNRLFV